MKVVAPSGAAMSGHFASDHGHAPPRPYSFAVSRATFDTILLRAAAREGAVVREGATVEDLVWDRGAVAGGVAGVGPRERATGPPPGAPWRPAPVPAAGPPRGGRGA